MTKIQPKKEIISDCIETQVGLNWAGFCRNFIAWDTGLSSWTQLHQDWSFPDVFSRFWWQICTLAKLPDCCLNFSCPVLFNCWEYEPMNSRSQLNFSVTVVEMAGSWQGRVSVPVDLNEFPVNRQHRRVLCLRSSHVAAPPHARSQCDAPWKPSGGVRSAGEQQVQWWGLLGLRMVDQWLVVRREQ